MKKLFCFLISLCALAALLLPACAQSAETEPDWSVYEGKSWDEVVDDFLEERGVKGERVSLGYYNTVTGEEHYYNGDELRTAASIYKLPLMMYYAEKLYLGEIDRETKIGPYTYDTLMYHAIRYSSNPAGEAMQKAFDSYKDYKLGIGKFLDIEDLPEDSLYYTTNKFSSKMMISCLKYLYDDPDRYPDLLDTLLHTERGDFLGFNEKRYAIAHKLGNLEYEDHTYLNDCAIVYTEQPILLVMLTDNVYGGITTMSAWCTLMCDYTDYTAAHPAMTPEPTPALTPAPTAAPSAPPAPENVKPAVPAEAGTRLTVLEICCAVAVILIAAKLVIFVKGRAGGHKRPHGAVPEIDENAPAMPDFRAALPLGAAALAAALLTAGLCVYAAGASPRILGDPGDPSKAAIALMDALCAGELDTAESLFAAASAPELTAEPESESAMQVWAALKGSYSYAPGDVRVDGVNAFASVTLKRLDLNAVTAELKSAVTGELTRQVEAARLESEIYDESGQYRPEFISRALSGALGGLLSDEKYLSDETFTLTLVYDRGRWLGVWDNAFSMALSGGAVGAGAGLASGMDMFVNNAASAALSGVAKIEKVYTLPEDLVVAPEPDQSLFGTAKTPEEISALLSRASELLDGQDTTLKPDTPLFGDMGVSYYLDETIFAACWKELINDSVYAFSEVKVAHPSQFRRMIGGDEFGSELLYHPSDLAAGCNAVVALSGDYYLFRNMGIVVHHGELYRTRGDYIDTCMIDGNGDMHFVYARGIANEQEARDYIEQNDIRFSLVFGPVLVENGEVVHTAAYPLGEVKDQYSRCGFGQLGKLHYLLATSNNEAGHGNVPVIADFAKVFQEHGCVSAYTLDGGQTGTMVMNDEVMNSVTFGYQRNISDIIFFATALPEQGGQLDG